MCLHLEHTMANDLMMLTRDWVPRLRALFLLTYTSGEYSGHSNYRAFSYTDGRVRLRKVLCVTHNTSLRLTVATPTKRLTGGGVDMALQVYAETLSLVVNSAHKFRDVCSVRRLSCKVNRPDTSHQLLSQRLEHELCQWLIVPFLSVDFAAADARDQVGSIIRDAAPPRAPTGEEWLAHLPVITTAPQGRLLTL